MVDSSKYIVLDVETNGLSSVNDDLLSISLFLPDKELTYNRYLPLEKQDRVFTTQFNGITKKDLKGQKPLDQIEFDELVNSYELDNRIILTYGNLDERFLKKYFKEHKLEGIEVLTFYNFKKDIISSKYSHGLISKDNLCKALNIKGVKKIHSGINDCILEWELFKKLDGGQLLITQGYIFRFSKDYYVPASYLTTYPNLKNHIRIPEFSYEKMLIKSFPLDRLIPFSNNLNGLVLENILFRLCGAVEQDNSVFLIENKRKLEYLGCIDDFFKSIIPISIDTSGNIIFSGEKEKEDKELFDAINSYKRILEASLSEVANYIKKELFDGERIISQELTINEEDKVLALSDISSASKVLEIKTQKCFNWNNFVCQLYYQSKGRETYCLVIDWNEYLDKSNDNLKIDIYRVFINTKEKTIVSKEEKFENQKKKYQQLIKNPHIKITKYSGYSLPVSLKCDLCGNSFKKEARLISRNHNLECPYCRKNKKGGNLGYQNNKKDKSISFLNNKVYEEHSKKYSLIYEYLSSSLEKTIRLSFAQIEIIIGHKLPKSAYTKKEFWSNYDYKPLPSNWLCAGYYSSEVDLEDKYVILNKIED